MIQCVDSSWGSILTNPDVCTWPTPIFYSPVLEKNLNPSVLEGHITKVKPSHTFFHKKQKFPPFHLALRAITVFSWINKTDFLSSSVCYFWFITEALQMHLLQYFSLLGVSWWAILRQLMERKHLNPMVTTRREGKKGTVYSLLLLLCSNLITLDLSPLSFLFSLLPQFIECSIVWERKSLVQSREECSASGWEKALPAAVSLPYLTSHSSSIWLITSPRLLMGLAAWYSEPSVSQCVG